MTCNFHLYLFTQKHHQGWKHLVKVTTLTVLTPHCDNKFSTSCPARKLMNMDMEKVHTPIPCHLSHLMRRSRTQISILIGRHLINTLPNLEAKQMVLLLAIELRNWGREISVCQQQKHQQQQGALWRAGGSAACPRRGVEREKPACNKTAVSARNGWLPEYLLRSDKTKSK